MKKCFILFLGLMVFPTLFAQKLKWVNSAPAYIDYIDSNQNIYIGASPYGITDIDPGPEVFNIDINKEGAYFVKYDSLFNIQWVKTDPSPDWGYERSIVNSTNDGELVVLTSKDSKDPDYVDEFYLEIYNPNGSLIKKNKALYLESGANTHFFDVFMDSNSNIWLSAIINGSIAYGMDEDTLIQSASYAPIIAKYNKDLDFIKIIQGKPGHLSSYHKGCRIVLDTTGTIHQIKVDGHANYYLATDTSGINIQSKLFESSYAEITHLNHTDDTVIIVSGTFTNAVDFDHSSEERFLSPKGKKDIFIAKYTRQGELLDVWQIGGSGSITTTYYNFILTSNYLTLGLISEGSSLIDFDLGTDTFNVALNNQMIYACYNMSTKVNSDNGEPAELNADQVADIFIGPGSSNPQYLVNFRDTLYFIADNGKSGYELWKSDGEGKGTSIVKDLTPEGSSFHPQQSVKNIYPVFSNDKYLFAIPDTLEHAFEIWRMSGDSSFTKLPQQNVHNQFILKNMFYAPTDDKSFFVSDGTVENTIIKTYDINVSDLNFQHIVNEDSLIYITSYSNLQTKLYSFNGDAFTEIASVNKLLYGLGKYNNRFYFYELNTQYQIVPIGLCSVDQSGGDYQELINFPDNKTRIDQAYYFIQSMDEQFIFLGYDSENNLELWKSDGTKENTSIIKDLNPDGNLNVNNLLHSNQGILFFTADDGHGNNIFQTNGTLDGTIRLRGLNPFGKVNYNSMAIVKDVLYFGATNAATGSELWKYKFVTEMYASEENRTYSSDSLSFTCEIQTDILPLDATDTCLTYQIVNIENSNATIDSLGILTVNCESLLKSASANDSIAILISTNDGSRISTELKLAVQETVDIGHTNMQETELCKLWPNPAGDILNIQYEADFTGSIVITDELGKRLFKQYYNKTRLIQLNLAQFPMGILYFNVNSERGSYTYKVIHQ